MGVVNRLREKSSAIKKIVRSTVRAKIYFPQRKTHFIISLDTGKRWGIVFLCVPPFIIMRCSLLNVIYRSGNCNDSPVAGWNRWFGNFCESYRTFLVDRVRIVRLIREQHLGMTWGSSNNGREIFSFFFSSFCCILSNFTVNSFLGIVFKVNLELICFERAGGAREKNREKSGTGVRSRWRLVVHAFKSIDNHLRGPVFSPFLFADYLYLLSVLETPIYRLNSFTLLGKKSVRFDFQFVKS